MRTVLIFFLNIIPPYLIIFYSVTAHAVDAAGYVNAIYDRPIGAIPGGYTVDSEVDMEGRLELKSKFKNHVRGVFAIDASAYNRVVIPSRLFLDYKPNKTWRLRIGYAKKIIGLAYEQNKEERLTIHRSEVYQKMNRSGLVGRQLAIGLRWRPAKKKRNTFTLALSHDGSRNSNVTYSAIHKMADRKGLRLGLWGIVEMREFKAVGKLNVFAHAAALWYERNAARFAMELLHGIDPDGTHFEMLFEKGRKVHFLCHRIEAAYRYRISDNIFLQPLLHFSVLFDDVARGRNNTLQFLGGINLQVQQIFFSINAETLGTTSPKDIGARRYERKNIYGELVYYF